MNRFAALLGLLLLVQTSTWADTPATMPTATSPASTKPGEPSIDPRTAIQNKLGKDVPLDQLTVQVVAASALAATFPNQTFCTATARQFPVARMVPPPLKDQNIFVVDAKGAVTHITSPAGLEDYFKANLPPVNDAAAAKQVLAAWLALSQEFSQDGMYRFATDETNFKIVEKHLDSVPPAVEFVHEISATGTAAVTAGSRGGSGLTATLIFQNGKLATITETRDIKPGVRPICQATKLLDPDPIVRKMAEQDILIMGRPCRDYLLEQRAKASPALQKAIDAIWDRITAEDPAPGPLTSPQTSRSRSP